MVSVQEVVIDMVKESHYHHQEFQKHCKQTTGKEESKESASWEEYRDLQ